MAYSKYLQKTWTPLIRIGSTSLADVIADYYFYKSIDDDNEVEKFGSYLFLF